MGYNSKSNAMVIQNNYNTLPKLWIHFMGSQEIQEK